jgi:hypothetical protein
MQYYGLDILVLLIALILAVISILSYILFIRQSTRNIEKKRLCKGQNTIKEDIVQVINLHFFEPLGSDDNTLDLMWA